MEAFPFLQSYIRLSRALAGLVAVVGIIQSFELWQLGFLVFVGSVVMTLLWAFLILVGADVLACFRAIELNTRNRG